MPSFDQVDEVRSLTQAQISRLNNAQLKTALSTILNTQASSDPSNAILLQEIKSLKSDIEQIKGIKQEVAILKNQVDQAFQIILQQQKFLESFDSKERQKKFIISGVTEGSDDLGENDQDKVKAVVDVMGYTERFNVNNWEMKRLGQQTGNRKRPILVIVENNHTRNAIVEKARNLKQAGPPFDSVYVKKDVHPAIRKELGRLRRREKEEKEKPENQGTNINYDTEQRVLLRDGLVIDRYAPNFF